MIMKPLFLIHGEETLTVRVTCQNVLKQWENVSDDWIWHPPFHKYLISNKRIPEATRTKLALWALNQITMY